MPSFDAEGIAGRLLGHAPTRVGRIKGGRNSEVWRIDTPDGRYALKRYIRSDAAERLGRETAALRFLERHGVETVPRVAATDAESGIILMSWLPGEPVCNASEKDILTCADFLALLRDLSRTPDAATLPDAKDPCRSAAVILAQVDARIAKFAGPARCDPRLRHFFETEVAPRRHALADLPSRYPQEFSRKFRTLTTADFCVHNAMRAAMGQLSFLDFEYFGWEDPAKAAADFLLHPGMDLPPRLLSVFAGRMHALFGDERGFAQRLAALLPAYELRWGLIMLNPILDAVRASTQEDADLAAVVRLQTERATRYLQRPPIAACEERETHVG